MRDIIDETIDIENKINEDNNVLFFIFIKFLLLCLIFDHIKIIPKQISKRYIKIKRKADSKRIK